MDNLKEQIGVLIYRNYHVNKLYMRTPYALAYDIVDKLLPDNSYYQLQAGEDGLLKPECICEIICQGILCKSRKHGGFCYEANLIYKCLKAQKALDDKEKSRIY